MSTWISKGGKWYPAKEHAVLPHLAGTDKEIYDGPDRAALYELYEQKVEYLGIDFKHDPDLLNRVKQLGYKDIDEYAKVHGYDEIKADEEFKAKAAIVAQKEITKRVEEIKNVGGGIDTTGSGKDIIGGFGDEHMRPLK